MRGRNVLKIIDIELLNNIISMMVLIEGNESLAYNLQVICDNDEFPVVKSDIPDEDKMYERQARIALRKYIGRSYPETITSHWF